MNFDKIKQEISIVSYLKSIGCEPQFENDYTARFIVPYRADTNPSLSINKNTNLCFDHGTGKGWNVIQLAALINNCNDYEAAKILTKQKSSFSFHCKPITEQYSSVKINKVKPLENITLLQYLQNRAIDIQIAQQYCKEAYYSVANRNYFAVAFENDSKNAYELRSAYFKGCIGAKDITTTKSTSNFKLNVFEGFIDMLSFATYYGKEVMLSFDTITLNSLANIRKAEPLFSSYQEVNLYLDNDEAGTICTNEIVGSHKNAIDRREIYAEYKDFNEFLIASKKR